MGSSFFSEAHRKRQELLDYRFGDIHGQRYFSGLDIRDMREGGVRIGLLGPIGSGKSSFINTCERALKPELRKGTAEIQTGHGEGTIVLQEFLDDIDNGFRLVDTRGLFRHNIDEFKALADIIYGRIKPGQMQDRIVIAMCNLKPAFPTLGEPDPVLQPKKKVWETVQPDLQVTSDKVATYKGVPFTVAGKGVCTSKTMTNSGIK
uniref:Uncharacterized protein n=1 Tax=Branchiostoma floridae TaxID=7739 RepID=C3XXP6_BRAFL|eukprot:XP_002611496.1 hypothetical protein BRAFLDRAFT_63869 [Branchiostoma floridae]